MTTPELPEGQHRVAVVVFLTCPGVDARDAGHVAEFAVRQGLAGGAAGPVPALPLPVEVRTLRGRETVQVHDVMEVGMAAANGYLHTVPSSRMYREVR